jgi:hypothetical protein
MVKKLVLCSATLTALAGLLFGRSFGANLVHKGQESNARPWQGQARPVVRPYPLKSDRLQVWATSQAVAKPAHEVSLHRALTAELSGSVTFGQNNAPAGPTHAGITLVETALPPWTPERSRFASGATYDGSSTCDASNTCMWAYTCWETCVWATIEFHTCHGASCDFSCIGPGCGGPTTDYGTCEISLCIICPPLSYIDCLHARAPGESGLGSWDP